MSTGGRQMQVIDADLIKERDYWLNRLSSGWGDSSVSSSRRQLKPSSTHRPRVDAIVTGRLYAELMRLSGNSPFLLYAVLVACVKTCLYRYTNSTLITVGSPALKDFEETNALPIVDSIDPRMDFKQLLVAVRGTLLDAYEKQRYPFAWMCRELGVAPPTERPVLFHVLLRLKDIHGEPPAITCDLTMTFETEGDQLSGVIEFDGSLFEEAAIERFRDHVLNVLRQVLEDPETLLCELDLLTDKEREFLLVACNSPEGGHEADSDIPGLFEAQVEKAPDAIALTGRDEQLTYRELNERSNQMARFLAQMGVGPEVLIGLCVERSIEMIVELLGILKAGGVYVPLDPSYPRERISFIVEDAGVAILLIHQERAISLGHTKQSLVVYVDDIGEQIRHLSKANLAAGVGPDNSAYVIYTSGTTGHPKGVMVSHRGIANLAEAQGRAFALGPGSRVLQFASLSFDASVWEIFGTLLSGSTLCTMSESAKREPAALIEILQENLITTVTLPPALLRILPHPELPALRTVIAAGERCSAELVRFWARGRSFINAYGPTEATVCASLAECVDDGVDPHIGRPISRMQVYLLDRHLQPVPIGVPGEVYLGGVGLARGYLERPELTSEKFVPNPFGSSGARLYKTGDLAYYLPDGNIAISGRTDYQIKLRGHRIELGEIEAALGQHPGVRDSVAVVREDAAGEKSLIAYVVPTRKESIALADHRLHRLPNNLRIAHLNQGETELMYKEIFRDQTYVRHGVTLKDGDCIFDVGANIGLFTLFASQMASDLSLYAFEPVPAAFEKLRSNTGLYGIEAKLFECGLSDTARTDTITYYPSISGMSGLYADAREDEGLIRVFIQNQEIDLGQQAAELLASKFESESLTCTLTTISNVIRENGLSRVDLLKIDVEKSELDVLRGINSDEDWDKIKQIVLEVHDIEGRLDRVTALLESKGYETHSDQDELFRNTGLYTVYGIRFSESERTSRAEGRVQRRPLVNDSVISVRDLRSFLAEKLPDYMTPAAFVFLEALPLTPSGKIDRASLPEVDKSRAELETVFVAPQTDLEKVLANVWQSVLEVPSIGIHDNFFQLGGDSLRAAIAMNQLQESAGEQIQVAALFEYPTIAELASFLNENHPTALSGICGLEAQPGRSLAGEFAKPAEARNTPAEFESEVQVEPVNHGVAWQIGSSMHEDDAQTLLANLDRLSQEEVDSLLKDMLSEQRNV